MFTRRGILPEVTDFSWPDLHRRIIDAGINTVGFHGGGGAKATPESTIEFINSDHGREVLTAFADAGVDVEYELHVMRWLLPRGLFDKAPEFFRMNDEGERTLDSNLCCSCSDALGIVAENAVELCGDLTSTTHRYFLWADDGQPWCQCPECRELTPSDQNLIIMNAIARALRAWDSDATLAVLAYQQTLDPPQSVEPEPNIFLEFAPIRRDSLRPINDPNCQANAELALKCTAAVEFFGAESAHMLEYWIDASRACKWKRPVGQLPYDGDVLREDLEFYKSLGFDSVTSFSCWLDAEYLSLWGEPPIADYGAALSGN